MLLEIRCDSFHKSVGYPSGKIQWIKDIRCETGVGLKQAKELADLLFDSPHLAIGLDTSVSKEFQWVEAVADISRYVRRLGPKEAPVEDKKPDAATQILTNTAIRLVKNQSYREARKVLSILMDK